MTPFPAQEARNAPKHAQRLDSPGSLDLSHVCRLPAKLIQNLAHDSLGSLIISANKHGGLASGELRIDHAGVANGIERFDEARIGRLPLQTFHQ